MSKTNGTGSFEIYDERNDFYHEIVNSPFYDGDVPCPLSNRVYISQLFRFARVCCNVNNFTNIRPFLTARLLKQGNRYHKIRKLFSKFYHIHTDLIVKYKFV